MKSTWKVCTDGGCPANPGPGAFAFVLEKDNGEKVTRSGFLPMATNNQAEYRAVHAAAWYLSSQPTLPDAVEIWSDSELVVRQLNGQYKVRDETLRPFYEEAFSALAVLRARTQVSISHFKREKNTEADELCNRILESRDIVIVSKKRMAALP